MAKHRNFSLSHNTRIRRVSLLFYSTSSKMYTQHQCACSKYQRVCIQCWSCANTTTSVFARAICEAANICLYLCAIPWRCESFVLFGCRRKLCTCSRALARAQKLTCLAQNYFECAAGAKNSVAMPLLKLHHQMLLAKVVTFNRIIICAHIPHIHMCTKFCII